MQTFFKIVYFAGMVAEIILRAPYDRLRRQQPGPAQPPPPGEQAILAGLTIGNLLLPLAYSLTSWLKFADYRWPRVAKTGAGIAGTGYLTAAVYLFWRAHRDLGANWSPTLATSEQQTLITTGVYASVRHPMYSSQALWVIGQALLLPNWIAGLAGVAAFLPLVLVRMPREERMMIERYGEDYLIYSQRTGQIVPKR